MIPTLLTHHTAPTRTAATSHDARQDDRTAALGAALALAAAVGATVGVALAMRAGRRVMQNIADRMGAKVDAVVDRVMKEPAHGGGVRPPRAAHRPTHGGAPSGTVRS